MRTALEANRSRPGSMTIDTSRYCRSGRDILKEGVLTRAGSFSLYIGSLDNYTENELGTNYSEALRFFWGAREITLQLSRQLLGRKSISVFEPTREVHMCLCVSDFLLDSTNTDIKWSGFHPTSNFLKSLKSAMPPAERSISNFFGIFPVQQKLSNKIGGIYISTSGMPVVKFSQKSGIKTISDKSAPIGLEAIAAFYGISRLIIEFKE